MTIRLIATDLADPGQERTMNEDVAYQEVKQASGEETWGLFIVADGMGGHLGGELASKWAVQAIRTELANQFAPRDPGVTIKLDRAELEQNLRRTGQTVLLPETLERRQDEKMRRQDEKMKAAIEAAIQRANAVLRDLARNRPEKAADTGSTVTMAVVQGNRAYVANVGDSRTYLFRDKQLRQITTDHSLVASLVTQNQIEPDEIYTHPQRNVIYRSLGEKPEVTADIFMETLQAGDQLILCSDGLWEMVRDEQLAKIVEKAPDVGEACRRLVQAANDNGGEDNISVIVVRVE
ncbi:MAG: PP2C family serine/threonine-protein phosphatase [Anaerolineae bacterium]